MQKLKLNIEELDVVSFRVAGKADAKGTVNAQSAQQQYELSEASACTCTTTGGTAFFTEGCEFTLGWKTC